MLAVEVVTQPQGLEALRAPWQELLCASPAATPFQSYEWLATWWQAFGRGRPGRRLFVLAVRDTDKLVGIAPFMTSPWYAMPVRRLSFLGEGATDYNDVLAAPGAGDDVCQAIYRHLAASPGWQVADLNQLREGGLLAGRPPDGQSGLTFQDKPQEACPYLPYPPEPTPEATWNGVLAGLGKKMRYNVGYYERLLRRAYDVEIEVARTPEEVRESLTALFELHQRRWNERWLPGVFGSRRVRQFHHRVAAQFLERGWLRLRTITLDGEVQAALYCFAGRDRTCYYQAGFEPTLARLSLGTVLTAHAIRGSIEEGHAEFDFLRGDEPYKERWTGGCRRMNSRRLIGRRGSAGLWIGQRVAAAESGVETRFKSWMHHRFAAKGPARDATH